MRKCVTASSIAVLVLIVTGSATADMTMVTYNSYLGEHLIGEMPTGIAYDPSFEPYGSNYTKTTYYDPIKVPMIIQDTITYDDDLYVLSFASSIATRYEDYKATFVEEYMWTIVGVFPTRYDHRFLTSYTTYLPVELISSTVTPELTVIPAPGAVVLGSIGLGLVGWRRRRR